jgi:hypothetical protein
MELRCANTPSEILDPTKEDLSVGACCSSGGETKCVVCSGGLRLVYNIKTDFKETGGEVLDWLYLDQDRKNKCNFVNKFISFRAPKNVRIS